jgi:acyl carrier protein
MSMKPANVTLQKILQITADTLGVQETALSYNICFSDDLGADSLDVYELVMLIEKEFKISITEDEAAKLKTVGKLIECVQNKVLPYNSNPQIETFKISHQAETILTNN